MPYANPEHKRANDAAYYAAHRALRRDQQERYRCTTKGLLAAARAIEKRMRGA